MHSDADEVAPVTIWGERKYEVPDLDEGKDSTLLLLMWLNNCIQHTIDETIILVNSDICRWRPLVFSTIVFRSSTVTLQEKFMW